VVHSQVEAVIHDAGHERYFMSRARLERSGRTAAEQGDLITVPGDADAAFARLREMKLIS
jgi:hypothetical protein